ncbi:MAG: tetratricopeptide repeat protein [Gemmataceae bacterium]
MSRLLLLIGILATALPAPAQTHAERARTLTGDALASIVFARLQQRDDLRVDAARACEEAVRWDADAVLPRVLLVHLYDGFDRPAEAARVAAAVLTMDPKLPATARTLARLHEEQGRTAAADAVLEAAAAQPLDASDAAMVLRDLGRLRERLGNPLKAAEAYRRAVDMARSERRGEFAEAAARAWLAAGRPDEAKPLAEISGAPVLLADVLGRLEQLDRARAILDRHLKEQPRDLAAYELLGVIARKADGSAAALRRLQQAVDHDPDFVALRILYGEECLKAGDTQRAAGAFQRVIETHANVAAYRGLFAALGGQVSFGMIDDAVRRARVAKDAEKKRRRPPEGDPEPDPEKIPHAWAMEAALGRDPATSRRVVLAGLASIRGDRRDARLDTWRLFVRLAERGDFAAEAEAQFRSALQSLSPAGRLGAYVALVDILELQRKHNEAVEVCRRGMRELQDEEFFNYYIAMPLAKLGRGDEAIKAIDAATDKAQATNKIYMRSRRVSVLIALDRTDEAITEAQAMLKDFHTMPDLEVARATLATAYVAARKFDLADEQLRLVLDLDPKDAEAHNTLGYELADRGRSLPEAEALVRRAIELDRPEKVDSVDEWGENPMYQDSLGWVLFRRGRWAEARKWIEQSLSRRRGAADGIIWDHLGDVCVRLGDTAKAREAWTKAEAIYRADPTSLRNERGQEVRRKLERLQYRQQP